MSDSTSCHEFASQVGLAFFIREKHPKTITKTESRASACLLNEPASDPSKRGGNAGHGRSITSDNMNGDNSDQGGNRLSQTGEKRQVKTATTMVYTFTA